MNEKEREGETERQKERERESERESFPVNAKGKIDKQTS